MLTSGYKVGWVKKGQKYAYIIFEWSLICCAGLDSNCITRAGHRLSGTDCTFHIFIGKNFYLIIRFYYRVGTWKGDFCVWPVYNHFWSFFGQIPFCQVSKRPFKKKSDKHIKKINTTNSKDNCALSKMDEKKKEFLHFILLCGH